VVAVTAGVAVVVGDDACECTVAGEATRGATATDSAGAPLCPTSLLPTATAVCAKLCGAGAAGASVATRGASATALGGDVVVEVVVVEEADVCAAVGLASGAEGTVMATDARCGAEATDTDRRPAATPNSRDSSAPRRKNSSCDCCRCWCGNDAPSWLMCRTPGDESRTGVSGLARTPAAPDASLMPRTWPA